MLCVTQVVQVDSQRVLPLSPWDLMCSNKPDSLQKKEESSSFFLNFGCTAQQKYIKCPEEGLNLCPLPWKCRVLTTEPPGKSQVVQIIKPILHTRKTEEYRAVNDSLSFHSFCFPVSRSIVYSRGSQTFGIHRRITFQKWFRGTNTKSYANFLFSQGHEKYPLSALWFHKRAF